MAKIEMDISEYEAMKENKKLLQDALDSGKKLQEKIESLQKEKIKALEDAKMKVVKIARSELTQHLLQKRSYNPIHIRNTVQRLLSTSSLTSRAHGDAEDYSYLQDVLFEYTTYSQSMPTETITTHGLDEIKRELKEKIEKKITLDIKEKLENADKLLLINKKVEATKKETFREYKRILELYEAAELENKLLIAQNKVLIEVDSLLEDKVTVWNFRSIFKQVKASLNKLKDVEVLNNGKD